MIRDFFLGFIKIHVLHHAAHEPIYGAAMMAELARHGYDLSPGTLYPLFHSLEEQGYLARTDRLVEGRVRKYYVITKEGRAALLKAKQHIAELVHEVLEEEGKARLPELPLSSPQEAEEQKGRLMSTVSVRYIVNDVDTAITFYQQHLDFHEEMHPAPTFAILSRGDLRLLLSAPSGVGGGGQAMPDGRKPEPGGWNRISLEVSDLPALVESLRKGGVHFRNDIVTGVGGKQILLEDPSGNPIELFEPFHQ